MPPLPPPVKLTILRDIGWNEWDPIGLQGPGRWLAGSNAADEYDAYLVHVAVRLQRGDPKANLVDYLVSIETEHMGLSPNATALPRAAATVEAINEYVQTLT